MLTLRIPDTREMPSQFTRLAELVEQPHPRITEVDGMIAIDLRTPKIPLRVCESRPNGIVILQNEDLDATTIGCSISKHMSGGSGYTIQSSITIIGSTIMPELAITTSNLPSGDATTIDLEVALRFVKWAIDVADDLLTDGGDVADVVESMET